MVLESQKSMQDQRPDPAMFGRTFESHQKVSGFQKKGLTSGRSGELPGNSGELPGKSGRRLESIRIALILLGKRGLLEKGSFQKCPYCPFSRDSREFRESRDLPVWETKKIRQFSRDSRGSASEKTPFKCRSCSSLGVGSTCKD